MVLALGLALAVVGTDTAGVELGEPEQPEAIAPSPDTVAKAAADTGLGALPLPPTGHQLIGFLVGQLTNKDRLTKRCAQSAPRPLRSSPQYVKRRATARCRAGGGARLTDRAQRSALNGLSEWMFAKMMCLALFSCNVAIAPDCYLGRVVGWAAAGRTLCVLVASGSI